MQAGKYALIGQKGKDRNIPSMYITKAKDSATASFKPGKDIAIELSEEEGTENQTVLPNITYCGDHPMWASCLDLQSYQATVFPPSFLFSSSPFHSHMVTPLNTIATNLSQLFFELFLKTLKSQSSYFLDLIKFFKSSWWIPAKTCSNKQLNFLHPRKLQPPTTILISNLVCYFFVSFDTDLN